MESKKQKYWAAESWMMQTIWSVCSAVFTSSSAFISQLSQDNLAFWQQPCGKSNYWTAQAGSKPKCLACQKCPLQPDCWLFRQLIRHHKKILCSGPRPHRDSWWGCTVTDDGCMDVSTAWCSDQHRHRCAKSLGKIGCEQICSKNRTHFKELVFPIKH